MPFIVTTYQSAAEFTDATGINIVWGLDENLTEQFLETGDEVITNGATFTIIKGGIPAGLQIVGKGAFFTVIEETA